MDEYKRTSYENALKICAPLHQGVHHKARLSREDFQILWNVFGACRAEDGSPLLAEDGRLKCFLFWNKLKDHVLRGNADSEDERSTSLFRMQPGLFSLHH
jgi:hypothetical protein